MEFLNLGMGMFAHDHPDHLTTKALEAVNKAMVDYNAKIVRIKGDLTMNGALKSAKQYQLYVDTRGQIQSIVEMSKLELTQNAKNIRGEFVGSVDGMTDIELLTLAQGATDDHEVDMIAGSPILKRAYLAREKVTGQPNELLETAYATHQMENPDLMNQSKVDAQATEILDWTLGSFDDEVGDISDGMSAFNSMVR